MARRCRREIAELNSTAEKNEKGHIELTEAFAFALNGGEIRNFYTVITERTQIGFAH